MHSVSLGHDQCSQFSKEKNKDQLGSMGDGDEGACVHLNDFPWIVLIAVPLMKQNYSCQLSGGQ